MELLNNIVQSLTKEEVRYIKIFLSKSHNAGIRKDIELFDAIRKGGSRYDENKIFEKLYSEGNKNAFYRLKNRLVEDINKCLLIQHTDLSVSSTVLNLLNLVKVFRVKGNFDLVLYYLRRAEKLALTEENYELLDIVYNELIRTSTEDISIDPNVYIEKRRTNFELLSKLRSFEDVLAKVIYQMKISQNVGGVDRAGLEELESQLLSISNDDIVANSRTFRFKLNRAIGQIYLLKRDYVNLEKFMLASYDTIVNELNGKVSQEVELQVLTYIVNSMYKNGKFKLAVEYADKLKLKIEKSSPELQRKYWVYYYSSLVNIYGVLNIDTAIELLLELQESKLVLETSINEVYILTNLAICYYKTGDFKKALKRINQLYLLDVYNRNSTAYKLLVAIVELVVRYELGDFEYLVYRINQIKKEFSIQLKSEESKIENEFISIVERLISEKGIKNDKTFRDYATKFAKSMEGKEQEKLISYSYWIAQKIGI